MLGVYTQTKPSPFATGRLPGVAIRQRGLPARGECKKNVNIQKGIAFLNNL